MNMVGTPWKAVIFSWLMQCRPFRGENAVMGHMVVPWVMAAVMATQVGLFLYSNVKYPYGCTMDFRYLAPAVLPGAVFLGAAGQRLWRSKREVPQYLAVVLSCVVFLFCVSGVFLYLTLS